MKFKDFLNESKVVTESASQAALDEIKSIELLAEDDGFEMLINFTDRDIKEHKAEYFASNIFEYPENADTGFKAGTLHISVDEDGYKLYDKNKEIAEENDILIEDDEDDRE